jgi:glycosyltransferase involved in cell wall biosynthesis
MRRLLILCEYPTLLGGERSMLATLPAVAAAGYDVRVAAPGGGLLVEALRECGVSHVPFEPRDDGGERLPLERLRAELAGLLHRQQPDLVHANSLSISRIAGPVVGDRGQKSVGHLRDIVKLSRQVVDDLNRHDVLVAVSAVTREFHVNQGLDAAKCVVAWNGVDLESFPPQARTGYLHHELGLPDGARLVAAIGQLGLRKGTDVALAAAARVATVVRDVHWLIVGERTSGKDESREFEQRLHLMANERPLRGRVHFVGQRADVREMLTECDLLVHAARQEPLGRVLLESAASGLPVVATDVGGTREIFPTEADGAVLVPADDVTAVAEAQLELLGDESRRRALQAGGRRRAEQCFDIRHAAARLLEIYDRVLT